MESHDPKAPSSSSRFLKTVCLHDWWLIKAEKDFEGKKLAVAGLTSREQQAVRVFSSAPIIKRCDVFTLETADGICIVLRGLLNKFRTNENGFSSEVFNHFLFGFPPFWEEYAEKYFGESTGVVLRRNSGFDKLTTDSGMLAGMENPSPAVRFSSLQEETPKKFKRASTEDRHGNIEDILNETKAQLEDNENMLLAKNHCNFHKSVSNECSIEVQKECMSQNVSEKITVDAPKGSNLQNQGADLLSCVAEKLSVDIGAGVSTSQDKGHPSFRPSPMNISVDNMKNDASEDCRLSVGSDVNTFNTFEINIAVPEEPSSRHVTKFSGRMDSYKSNRKGNERTMGKSKGYDVDNVSTSNICQAVSVEASSMNLTISPKRPESLQREQKVNKKDLLKSESSKISSVSLLQEPKVILRCPDNNLCGINSSNLSSVSLEGTQKESLSITPVVGNPKILEPSGNCFDDTMKYPAAQSDLERIVATPSKVDMNMVNATPSSTDSSRRTILKTLKSNQEEKPVSGSYLKYKNKYSPTSKAFENPYEERLKGPSTQLKIAVGKREGDAKGAGTSGKKTKRKLKYDTHVSPLTQGRHNKASIVSPESMSLKRSKSGRLLVPTLEFWRNQVAVYDADRLITGIQEGIHVEEPSRGSRSVPQKKQRQLT